MLFSTGTDCPSADCLPYYVLLWVKAYCLYYTVECRTISRKNEAERAKHERLARLPFSRFEHAFLLGHTVQ